MNAVRFARQYPKEYMATYAVFTAAALSLGYLLVSATGIDTVGLVTTIGTEFPSLYDAYDDMVGGPETALAQSIAAYPKTAADLAITATSQLLFSASYPFLAARICKALVEKRDGKIDV